MTFTRVLVANRGEIAVRIIRGLHDLGMEAVAVFSEADRAALHVRLADFAYPVGPPPAAQSYLRGDAMLDVARRSGAHAVHPGYGFLSENASFARACAAAGVTFIGPTPEAMAQMGDKVAARQLAAAVGVPTVPGTPDPLPEGTDVTSIAAQIGYPLLIKAAAGGGGKGMRAVRAPQDLVAALAQARSEAASSFGDGSVYLERLIERPRHIEVQVFGDGTGQVVHLGERECSVQRRYQKVVEEAPAPNLPDTVRHAMWDAAVRLASAAHYTGAGTLEFLYEPATEQFFFLEMNARLQVEHPVTELVTGVDLVHAQLKLAAGATIEESLGQRLGTQLAGGDAGLHAVEVRICAEDPDAGWLPSTGTLDLVREPAGPGIRVDSACEPGVTVTVHYDSLLAKLIAWGRSRNEAVARLRRALDEYRLTGVRTNLPFHRWIVRDGAFLRGDLSTSFIADRWHPESGGTTVGDGDELTLRVAALAASRQRGRSSPSALSSNGALSKSSVRADSPSAWRRTARQEAQR